MTKVPHYIFIIFIIVCFYKFLDFEVHTNFKNVDFRKVSLLNVESYFKGKAFNKRNGQVKMDSPEEYGKIQRQLRTPKGKDFPEYKDNYLLTEYRKAKANSLKYTSRNELNFISRGPGNVAGRTRAILFDPRDSSHSSWIAGSASGGIWKTKDAGKTWVNVSQDLPILSTNSLAMSANNPDVIYAGTGEHFVDDTDGNGIFKSIDGGDSWVQIADPLTYNGFKNVSRIIVDPNDENIVLASTSNGSWVEVEEYFIWKSIDGGENWFKVYTSEIGRIDDLDANPKNFNVIYATIEEFGVIKSLDAGETWVSPNQGFVGVGRVEISVSPVDTARIWASADGGESEVGSSIYISNNSGVDWTIVKGELENINYLGGQGFYDNIITAHPYNANIAYVGGINIFKVELLEESFQFQPSANGSQVFMDFVNGIFFGGGIQAGTLTPKEMKSIEIRFGQGSQKAHRFTVNMQGAGVDFGDYDYNNYVDVPFQVWDIDNNKQLMVSFRDQQEDGKWNLIGMNTAGPSSSHSREYIFVHNVEYKDSADSEIAKKGGTNFDLMYFLWPHLVSGALFNPDNLPNSTLRIDKTLSDNLMSASRPLSDAYFDFDGINSFSNENFINQKGLHPDQHNIVMIKEDEENETFRFLVTNDGGVYVTNIGKDPGNEENGFNYGGFGYNTSQYYGSDKAPGEDRYIGGTQDNSTWFSPQGIKADSTTRYEFAIGGDGFEAIWNNGNPNQLLASSQFNGFSRSIDNGKTWKNARNGLADGGPFISRLANSKRYPNRIFAIGLSGVWKSDDFGENWSGTALGSQWSFNNSADVEVSQADSSIIWAGGELSTDERVFVSTNGGNSYNPVSDYKGESLGFVSGIGTHPAEKGTAYLLFSFAGKPKIIKTVDFGSNWADISGFEGSNGTSNRGFPDVAINCLLVFPNNTERIWVGSEIGIIESLDSGASWHLLNSNMPPVNVHEFKIQDDQIVIATYGRGIWTVEVDGIGQNYVLEPSVIEASMSLSGILDWKSYLPNVYDSSFFYANGILLSQIGGNILGDFNQSLTEIDLDGEIDLVIKSFLNGIQYVSPKFTINLFTPRQVVDYYENNFDDSDRQNEFSGFGFKVKLEAGFDNIAIHSDHFYPDEIDYTYTLKSPYVLTNESPNKMQYDNVAIIEPGELGTVFGDFEFWDYVIVEGSKDGLNWTELLDGYDCRLYPEWTSAFESGSSGKQSMYKKQKIELEDSFEVGDTILIRFRLSSDQAANGWGWAIDNVEIGELTNKVSNTSFEKPIKIFPNPTISKLNIETDQRLNHIQIDIFDINGSLIKSIRNQNLSGISGIDVQSLPSGTYFIQFKGKDIQKGEVHKFIKL